MVGRARMPPVMRPFSRYWRNCSKDDFPSYHRVGSSGRKSVLFAHKAPVITHTDQPFLDLFYEIGIDSLTLMRLGGTSAVNSHPVNRPAAFELYPNFPNPFNPSTTIRFTLSGISDIVLAIFDIHGGLVRNLKQETLNTGSYSVTWDGQDNQGQILPSGIYLCQLKSGSFSKTQRMMLLK